MLQYYLTKLVIAIRYGEVESTDPVILLPLYNIHDGAGKMSEHYARDLGVDEAVAHDEYVEERLAQRSTVLHLPDGLVVLPSVEGVVQRFLFLVYTDLKHGLKR